MNNNSIINIVIDMISIINIFVIISSNSIVIVIEPLHQHWLQICQDVWSYEMLHIVTLKVSVLFVCTMQIVQ